MRFIAKWRARLGGYFWKRCDVCGRHFGGHEHGGGTLVEDGHQWITCPRCPGEWVRYKSQLWRPAVRFMNGQMVTLLLSP